MRLLRVVPFLLLFFNFFHASAQDNCAGAQQLCAGNSIFPSTIGGTTVASDPVLPCGDGVVQRSIWFTVVGINAGTAIITISNIDNNPGLSISAYTGTCGSLIPIPGACNSANGPAGSASISFATAAGVTYYIMVDGEAGNQEVFTITATTPDDGIMARPTTSFVPNPADGCVPLCVLFQNATTPHGTPIAYQWSLCTACPFIPGTGNDTTVCFNTTGTPDISLRATNGCGSATSIVPVTIFNMVPVINYSPIISCVGQPIDFAGSVSLQPPTTPPTPLSVTGWFWNFGDPLSGPSNTSTLQNPTHVFLGSPPFTVTLVVDGTCGPDTAIIIVNLLPPPIVTATAGSPACQLSPVSLTSVVDSATSPITYLWSGPGTITCDTCQNTTATGLPPGGPYVFAVTITDANGCTATDTASVFINPLPIANAGIDTTVCRNSPVQLNGTASGGTPPYTYAWTPGWQLSDSAIANPIAIVTIDTMYCLVVTDSFGCASIPECVSLNIFPPPTINSPPSLCATDPAPLQSTFIVSGAGAGSTYQWGSSTDYIYITSANVDSSSVTATYPWGVPATYNFTVIVTDGVTGCIDTLTVSYTINPGLSMTLNGPFTICAGQSVTLNATGATTYAWTASPPYPFADSTLASQNVSPATTTTFTVLGTTGTCTQQLSTNVTVNPNPVAVAAPIPNFCGCATVSLNGTGSTPGMGYQWSSAGGNPIISPTSLVTTSDICTSDVFMLVVTDTSTGCSDTATTSANSTAKPNATASVTPDTICNGVSTVDTLNGTGSDTNPGTTYLWTSSPVVPIANDTLLVTTATVTTTTIFTLTVTATTGCDSVVTTTVQIYPPHVLTGNPGALCTTDPLLQATLTINGAGPGSTYNWIVIPPCASPNTVPCCSVQSQLFGLSLCGAGNFTFTVVVTDGVTGCVDTISTTIPIVVGVTLATSNDTTICQGDVASLTASGALNYAWTASPPYPFADSTQANQNVSPSATTTFIVTGTTGTCSDTDTILVTVNPVPVTQPISGPISVCEFVAGQIYTTTGGAGSTFFWTVTGGILVSGQGNDTIIVDWGSAGVGTITVVETNSFGCPGPPQVLNVTINPLPNTSAIAGPDTVCSGDSAFYSVTNVAGSTYTWTVTGGTYTGSGSGITITWGAPGTGTVTVVETNAVGCSDTAVILNVVINPVPVTPPITGPNPVCENTLGSVYTVPPAGGSTYNWVITGNGVITFGQGTNSITVDWGAAGSATITLTQTNSSGCPGLPVTYTVTINAQPTASITAVSNDTICAGSSVNLTGAATNGTILWTTSGSGSFSNATIPSPTYTSAATDTPLVTLTMTVSNPPCANAVATVQITVLPLPVTSVINGPDTVCENTTGVAYFVTNNPGSTYSWNVTGGIIASGNGSSVITVNWGAAGSGTVSVTEFNFFGCQGSTSNLNITINPSPVPITIAGPDTLCQNSIGTYIISPSTAGSTYTWTVTGGFVSSPGNDTTDITWTTAGNQTIIVIETNSFGCPGIADTFNVHVNPVPAPLTITGPDTVCQNDIVVYYVGNTPSSTYNWGITNGSFTQNGDTITVTWGVPPGGSLSVSETDSLGCTGATTLMAVVINPVPLLQTINGTNLICEGDTGLIYDVNPTAGSYFLWSVTGGIITSPNDSTASIIVNWGTAGGGTVTVVEVNPFGCSTTNVISVTINATPVANATALSDTICASVADTLNGVALNGNVLWQTTGTGTFGDSSMAVTWYTPGATDTGTTVLSMIVSNPPCPNDTAIVSIYITPAPIVTVTTSSSPVDTVCLSNSITITATGGGTYLWSTSDTTASVIDTPAVTGYYYVMVSNNFGCSTLDSILVTVIPPGTANAGSSMVICKIDSATLSGIVLNAGGGVWTTSGNGTFVPDSATLSATYVPGSADIVAGTVTLVLTATGSPCWNLSDTIVVTLDSFITVKAGPGQTVYRNQTATINGTVTGTPNGWWTTTGSGTFVPDSTSLSATYQPSQNDYNSGFIYLYLHASNACGLAIDSLKLDFPDIIVPNVFSPGTDGFNDYFEIRGLPAHSKLEVFNRWGQIVFKADNYRNNWDAAELNDDTYYYIINTPPPENKSYHGHIRVIKEKK